MKKAARIIIPIILALTILLGTAWYLFMFDKDLTRDLFLHSARYFQRNGNLKLATWAYDCAYKQSDDNASVAIELSRQHAKSGNYLQAEIALTDAIANHPSAELYVALSKLYVDQDKIMDAVKLLDTVCAENSAVEATIKNELIAKRPMAPALIEVHDKDDEKIIKSVEITASSGALYVNRDGDYPSTTIAAHYSETGQKNILLNEGDNAIYAISIAKNGLVSPLTYFEYNLNSNYKKMEEVTFVDKAMEAALREALNADPESIIMTGELWALTEFTVPSGVASLDDLTHLIGLNKLTIESAPSNYLSYLKDMPQLTELSITDTRISADELSIITSLPNLRSLTLSKCSLSSLNGFENLKQLTYLDVSNNSILDITPITGLTKIQTLDMSENSLATVAGIENITSLEILDLSMNVLVNLNDLANCSGLKSLNVSGNQLTSLDAIVTINSIEYLNFDTNAVTTLPNWDKNCSLVTIEGSYNAITSLEPLSGLANLNTVNMDFNPDLESVTCLKDCYLLIQVNVFGTKVRDVKALLDMDVIVKYDPT